MSLFRKPKSTPRIQVLSKSGLMAFFIDDYLPDAARR